jgi:hypothetical protein
LLKEEQTMSDEIIALAGQPEEPDKNTNRGADPSRGDSRARNKRRRRKGSGLSREECLAMLSQLPNLVLLKVLSPAQANSIRGVLHTILQTNHGSQPTGTTAAANDDLLRTLRERPELLQLIEPLLTDETFNMLMEMFKERDEPRT